MCHSDKAPAETAWQTFLDDLAREIALTVGETHYPALQDAHHLRDDADDTDQGV